MGRNTGIRMEVRTIYGWKMRIGDVIRNGDDLPTPSMLVPHDKEFHPVLDGVAVACDVDELVGFESSIAWDADDPAYVGIPLRVRDDGDSHRVGGDWLRRQAAKVPTSFMEELHRRLTGRPPAEEPQLLSYPSMVLAGMTYYQLSVRQFADCEGRNTYWVTVGKFFSRAQAKAYSRRFETEEKKRPQWWITYPKDCRTHHFEFEIEERTLDIR